MDAAKKMATFVKVAKLLNQAEVIWAVGASFLLYLKGISKQFNDIDIMIAESDVEKVKRVLADVGTLRPREKHEKYKTKAFLEYMIEGTDFDIIAGFTIVADGRDHYFPLTKENIIETVLIDNTPIPLQSVEEWKHYYRLMGREDKVQLIASAALKND